MTGVLRREKTGKFEACRYSEGYVKIEAEAGVTLS